MRTPRPDRVLCEPSVDEGNIVRMLAVSVVCVGLASFVHAGVFGTVYRHDGITPFAPRDPNTPDRYSDIMVGTHLVLVIESDVGGLWWGALSLSRQDWQRGELAARGDDSGGAGGFKGSCLEAAGELSIVDFFEVPYAMGFQLTTHHRTTVAGEWFVLDYYAKEVGACDVGLFDYIASPDAPTQTFSFTHVLSRDFDGDTVVNFGDFALLASRWRQPTGLDPNTPPTCDIDGSHRVDPRDVALFCEYWLERTDHEEPAAGLSVTAARL